MIVNIIEILGIIIMLFVVIGVHELGHLIAGLVQGFRFEIFVVGPLGIKRENNEIKVYLNKNIGHYGGIASTIPANDNAENSTKFSKIILAGPIASLILAVILGSLYFLLNLNNPIIILIGALASTGIFFITLIPMKTGMFFSDGKRYQRLTSNGPEREVELAVLRVISNYSKDDSYINVNANDIEIMISDEHYKYFGLFTKLTYQFETNGNFDLETKNKFDELSKTMPKSMVKFSNKELEKLTK
tara:strand:+ start:623 stop:1357 length:735 start_codon:yes stop_codon:yes gene_type:complete